MRPLSSVYPIFIILFGLLSVSTLRSIDASYGVNQLLFFLVALAAFWGVSRVPFYWLSRGRWWWYGGIVLLLAVTLLIGRATNGSVSWIRLGAYRLQPSEFAKPVLALLLAVEAARRPVSRWPNLWRFLLLAGLPLALVLIQPDFGTAAIIASGAGVAYLLSRPNRRHVIALLALGLLAGALAWTAVLKPYQRDRIQTFLNPTSDPLGSGYNAQQAIIAVGAGGWLGTGFGKGGQSHLRFLPERQTDFLFATYAEETGFVGSFFLLCLYAGLFGWIAYQLSFLRRPEQVALGGSLLGMLMVQSFINMGMNMGIAPITGVTLPFFSLGGSSLLSSAILLGVLEALRRGTIAPQASLT